jgi:hypothetical protein
MKTKEEELLSSFNKQGRYPYNQIKIVVNKAFQEGKAEIIKLVDDWFDGRGEMERWEWNKLKEGAKE